MAKNTDSGRERSTIWAKYGEALGHLQDSLFLDRDYWFLGNLEQRSMSALHRGRSRD